MAKEQKNMTLEEALDLLKGDILDLSRNKSASVMAIVRAADPNHPLLKKAEERIEAFNKAEQEAILYQKNLRTVDEVASQSDYNAFISDPANSKDIAVLVQKTEIEDENGKVLGEKEKTEHFKRLYYGTREKATISIVADATASGQDLSTKDKAEVQSYLREQTKAIFYGDFAAIVAARQFSKPKGKEGVLGSHEQADFIRKQSQKALEIFNNLLNQKDKIRVKSDHFIASAVDTIDVVENYLDSVRTKLHSKIVQSSDKAKTAYTEVATRLQKGKTHLVTKAKALWGNRYELMKGIKNSMKDNKYKMIGDATAAFATLGLMSAAGPAIWLYAGYHVAGSVIWPLAAEMRKMNRERKEAGKAKLPFMKNLKLAWRTKAGSSKKSLRERWKDPTARSYFISVGVNTIGAVVGATVLSQIVKAHNATQAVADTVNGVTRGTRRTIALGRAGMAAIAGVTDGTTDKVIANKLAKKLEQVQDPKQKAKLQAQIATLKKGANMKYVGAGVSTAAALVGQAAMGYFAHNNVEVSPEEVNAALNTGNNTFTPDGIGGNLKPLNLQDSLLNQNGTTNLMSTDSTAVQMDSLRAFQADSLHMNGADSTPFQSLTDAPADISGQQPEGLFPTEWNQDMGITKGQFNVLTQTTEGTLSGDNPNITLDRAYTNAEALAQNLGKTKEQVLWDMNRLYAFMRKAVPMGDGTLREAPHGAEYLTERFGKMNLGLDENAMKELVSFAQDHTYDGKADILAGLKETYGDQFNGAQINKMASIITSNQRFYQHGEEMEALLKAVGCGEEMSPETLAKVSVMLDNTNEILGTGDRNVALTGLNLEDCPKDQGEWRAQAIQDIAQKTKEEVTTPVVEQTPTPPAEDLTPPVVQPQKEELPPVKAYPVGKATVENWDQLTGQKDPLYQKHWFDTTVKEPVQLEDVPNGNNEAVRNVSETASETATRGRTIEKVSTRTFKQITGQEALDRGALKGTYQVADTHETATSAVEHQVTSADETATSATEHQVENTEANTKVRSVNRPRRSGGRLAKRGLERGSASTAAQLFGQKNLDR